MKKCPRCGENLNYLGVVEDPPIIAQARGDTRPWVRERFGCLDGCKAMLDYSFGGELWVLMVRVGEEILLRDD